MDNKLHIEVEESQDSVIFYVKVIPGSSKTCIAGIWDKMLKVKISAPAEKGKANQCLIEFFSQKFGLKRNEISIISGKTNPIKKIRLNKNHKDLLSDLAM